jgi:hypothetical protein
MNLTFQEMILFRLSFPKNKTCVTLLQFFSIERQTKFGVWKIFSNIEVYHSNQKLGILRPEAFVYGKKKKFKYLKSWCSTPINHPVTCFFLYFTLKYG